MYNMCETSTNNKVFNKNLKV